MVYSTVYERVKKEMKRMNKKISKELKNLAGRLSIEEKEMETKYNEIATTNGLNLEEERQQLICLFYVIHCLSLHQ